MTGTAVRTLNNTFISLASNILIKGFSFVALIFVARKIDVIEFGSFSFVITVISILNLVVDLGISTALVKIGAQDFSKLRIAFSSALTFRLIWGSGLIILILYLFVQFKLISPNLGLMYLFYFLSIIPAGVIALISAVFIAREKIYLVSVINCIITVLSSTMTIIILLLGGNLNQIAVSYYFFLILQVIILSELQKREFFGIKYEFNFDIAKDLIKQGLPFLLIALHTILYYRLDILMLMWLKGEKSVAIYNVANRYVDFMILLPAILVSVTFPVLAKFARESNSKMLDNLNRIIKYNFLLGTGIALFLIVFAKQLIFLPFGEKFAPAVPVLMILALTLLFTYINSPLSSVFYALGWTKKLILVPALLLLLNIILNFFLIPSNAEVGASISTVITEIIGFFLIIFLVKQNKLEFNFTKFYKNIFKIFLAGLITFLIFYPFVESGLTLLTFFQLLGLAVVYFGLLAILNIFNVEDLDVFRIFLQQYKHKFLSYLPQIND